MVYALIPLLLGLPVIGYVLATLNHVPVEQFAPPVFVAVAIGIAAVFGIAAQSYRDAERAKRAAKKALTKTNEPKNQP